MHPLKQQPIALLAGLPLIFAAWASTTSSNHASHAWSFGGGAQSYSVPFNDTKVTLDGASERPDPVKTDATGSAKFSWSETSPIAFTIEVSELSSRPTAAHIHGPAGVEGTAGVIVPLMLDTTKATGRIATGTIDMKGMNVSLDSLKKLIHDGMAYVNVHTVKHPNGEIRGQFKSR